MKAETKPRGRPGPRPGVSLKTARGVKPASGRGSAGPRVPVVIKSLSDHKDPSFAGMMTLFNRVFPPKEKIDRGYFEQILAEKRLGLLVPFNTHVLVAQQGSRVVGFATGTYLAVVNMGFVGYLAVDPALKGQKLGGRLRRRLVQDLRRDARAARYTDLDAVLGEIEADNPWLRHLNRLSRVLALDIAYRQPPLREGEPEVPLVLYVEAIRKPIARLSAGRVRAVLYAIYRRLYRLRFPLREASFRAILESIGKRRIIGPLKLPPEADPPGKPGKAAPRAGARRAAGTRS